MLLYDVNPALAAAQSMSILHKTYSGLWHYLRMPMPQNKTNPTPIVEKVFGRIYRMQWWLHFANEMCKFPLREYLLDLFRQHEKKRENHQKEKF